MAVNLSNYPRTGVGDLASLDSVTSTGPGTAYVLEETLSNWSVSTLLAGATESTILLEGSAASSSDAPFSTIMSITASTDGETNSTTGFPAKQVRLTVDSASSSAFTQHGWIAGTP